MSPRSRRLLRNFLIELIVYGTFVTAYFLIVLRYFSDPLTRLFQTNLPVYAVVGLVLIVAQAVVLESVTSWLIRRLGLETLE